MGGTYKEDERNAFGVLDLVAFFAIPAALLLSTKTTGAGGSRSGSGSGRRHLNDRKGSGRRRRHLNDTSGDR